MLLGCWVVSLLVCEPCYCDVVVVYGDGCFSVLAVVVYDV